MAANASHLAAVATPSGNRDALACGPLAVIRAHRPTDAKSKGQSVLTPQANHVRASAIARTQPQTSEEVFWYRGVNMEAIFKMTSY